MPDKYYKILMKLVQKALKKDEVPISALLVCNNKIIAKAYNTKEHSHDATNHAEILVIKKASKKLKTWHLDNCEMYVTLKPCPMCESALNQTHIKKVTYLLAKPVNKLEYNKTKYIKTNISTQEQLYANYLQAFFQKKRDKI